MLKPESSPLLSRKERPVLALLLLTILAFFYEVTALRRALFYHDISLLHYPARHFFAEQWKRGRYPLWCPDLLGGYPLFAEGQAGPAYPPNLLLYPFLKTWIALDLSAVLHYALAGLGMYLLLRTWTAAWPAALGGLAYALNGWMVAHSIHVNAIQAAAWIPLVFLFLERTCRQGQAWPLLAAAGAFAMTFLAGYPHLGLYTAAAAALFLLLRAAGELYERRPRLAARAAAAGCLLFALTFGLAAVQLLPSRELLQQSDRQEAQSYEFLTYGSFPPPFAGLFFLPKLFGSRGRDTHWLDGPDLPLHEMHFYLGLLPLFLAAYALARRRDPPTLFFAVLVAFSALWMLGKYTPFFHLHEFLPVFNRLRQPARYAYLLEFALAALAGLGLDQLGRDADPRTRPVRSRAPGLGLLAGLFAAAALVPAALALWAYAGRPTLPPHQAYRLHQELVSDAIRSGLFLVISTALLALFRAATPQLMPKLFASAFLVSALDLASAHRAANPTIEPAYYEDPPRTARWLHDAARRESGPNGPENPEASGPGPGDARVGDAASTPLPHPAARAASAPPRPFRIYDFERSSDPAAPGWQIEWPYIALRERLNACMPMSYGIATLDGIPGLYPDRWWPFCTHITANRLGVMAVRYVVGVPPRDAEWFEDVQAGTTVPIYRNRKAAPRAYLTDLVFYIPDPEAFVQVLESPDFHPAQQVLLEEAAPSPAPGPPDKTRLPSGKAEQTPRQAPHETPGGPHAGPSAFSVTFLLDEPDRIVLDARTDRAAYLVLADAYFPGWEATVGGQAVPILRANFYARAVSMGPGRHRVEFRYRPRSFRLGLAATVASALLAAFAVWLCRGRTPFQLGEPDQILSTSEISRMLLYLAAAAAFVTAISFLWDPTLWLRPF